MDADIGRNQIDSELLVTDLIHQCHQHMEKNHACLEMKGGNNEMEKRGEKIRKRALSRLIVSPDQLIPHCMLLQNKSRVLTAIKV